MAWKAGDKGYFLLRRWLDVSPIQILRNEKDEEYTEYVVFYKEGEEWSGAYGYVKQKSAKGELFLTYRKAINYIWRCFNTDFKNRDPDNFNITTNLKEIKEKECFYFLDAQCLSCRPCRLQQVTEQQQSTWPRIGVPTPKKGDMEPVYVFTEYLYVSRSDGFLPVSFQWRPDYYLKHIENNYLFTDKDALRKEVEKKISPDIGFPSEDKILEIIEEVVNGDDDAEEDVTSYVTSCG